MDHGHSCIASFAAFRVGQRALEGLKKDPADLHDVEDDSARPRASRIPETREDMIRSGMDGTLRPLIVSSSETAIVIR